MPQNDSKATEPASAASLADEQIVTERKLPRRAFFIAAATLIAGGAALVAYGADSPADPDQKKSKRSDPDQKKKKSKKGPERSDPDQKKKSEPPSP